MVSTTDPKFNWINWIFKWKHCVYVHEVFWKLYFIQFKCFTVRITLFTKYPGGRMCYVILAISVVVSSFSLFGLVWATGHSTGPLWRYSLFYLLEVIPVQYYCNWLHDRHCFDGYQQQKLLHCFFISRKLSMLYKNWDQINSSLYD